MGPPPDSATLYVLRGKCGFGGVNPGNRLTRACLLFIVSDPRDLPVEIARFGGFCQIHAGKMRWI